MPPNNATAPEFNIEPLNFDIFTMDPAADNSEAFLPIDTVPTLQFLGTVCGALVHLDDGGKAVDVKVSNYMQSKIVDSIYR